jgi:Glycosyl transferases group 1
MSRPDGGGPRVALIAPFARGRAHGGSQRATAIAERLEEHGIAVEWRAVAQRETSRGAKALAMVRLQPALATLYDGGAPLEGVDVAIAAHSYLAPQLERLAPAAPQVVDFPNLEWRHLADLAASEERLRRRPYARAQAALMRRHERRLLAEALLALFVSPDELAWARSASPAAELLLVPSVLPRAEADAARRLAAGSARGRGADPPRLLYFGTLDFPPNLRSLLRFLRECWPAIRAAVPGVELDVAGRAGERDRARIATFPGVTALGFVDELEPLLERSAATVLPVDSEAGTSLRCLFLALAGRWVIASPQALRGIPWPMGATAERPEEWASAVAAVAADGERSAELDAARRAAEERQQDPAPWDLLAERIRAAAGAPSGTMHADG